MFTSDSYTVVLYALLPGKGFFDFIFQKIGDYKLDEILIVGDSLTSDMQGGNNAGIKCCWYNPTGQMNKKNLRIDYEISNLQEVKNILQ